VVDWVAGLRRWLCGALVFGRKAVRFGEFGVVGEFHAVGPFLICGFAGNTAHASSPSVDSMGHVILPHAFDASIRAKGLRGPNSIRLLAGHDPEKIAGLIVRLETVGTDLQIDGLLHLNISYSRDLYEAAKQTGGLSFSVGFRLEEFEIVEAKNSRRGESLIVKQGELLEVSIVSWGACPGATMHHIKSAPKAPVLGLAKLQACMDEVRKMKEILNAK
jgi:HK97 family phage prohead protease